jgi:hypothetical protein
VERKEEDGGRRRSGVNSYSFCAIFIPPWEIASPS